VLFVLLMRNGVWNKIKLIISTSDSWIIHSFSSQEMLQCIFLLSDSG
jgi:hypothetical protein